MKKARPILFVTLALAAVAALASPRTVCTITVNSPDEKQTIASRLPKGDFRFVELLEKGRPDWLRSACTRNVQCDVLVVSGHFNAGDDFYSDQVDNGSYLRVDELERASCSQSCPGLFAKLKEVYLFGCESLNPEATKNATHGESGRERMRRIFSKVPVIYGFSSSAPVGPTAAMLLNRHFDAGAGRDFASGRPSSSLLRIFARNSMVSTRGADDAAASTRRAQVCQFFDERLAAAEKLRGVHQALRGDSAHAREFLERIEKFLAATTEAERATPAFVAAREAIAADAQTRERFLGVARGTREPAIRARLVGVAGQLGWLTPEAQGAEHGRMITELAARDALGFGEVDLICGLGRDGALASQVTQVSQASSRAAGMGRTAALACMGSPEAHAQVLASLSSPDARDVQVAQVYLRHRPPTDARELRSVAAGVARMPGSAAQVRALDTLGRLRIADQEIMEELTRVFAAARTPDVQRAVAEVFLRAGYRRPELAVTLKRHRIAAPGGRDLIDALLEKLQSTS